MISRDSAAAFSIDSSKEILTVDSHTAGEATRLIVGGVGPVRGITMAEKLKSFQDDFDPVRRLLTREPRGHRDLLAAMLCPGCSEGSDFGLIYMDAKRYPFLCGHATIGAVATLVRMGYLKAPDGLNRFVVDTPSGPLTVAAQVERGQTRYVALTMVPSFVYRTGQEIEVPGFGKLRVDLVCTGGFFAMISSAETGIPILPENTQRLTELGMAVIDAANQQLTVSHPLRPEVRTVDVTEFYDPAGDVSFEGRNFVVYGESHVDRSPCGTGTTAKLALLHHLKKIEKGRVYTNKSPLNTEFRGIIVEETTVGDLDAVVVEIRGNAHITGVHRFMIDPGDPFPEGFLLS